MKCELCQKEFNRKPELCRHQIYCKKKYDFLKQYNLDKEKIQEEYDNLGSILNFIKKYPGLDQKNYYRIFQEFEIDYSLKKSVNHKKVRDKYKETCLKKWGTEHNFSRDCQSRKDWENRLFEEEGITNVFQRPEVIEKITETLVKKYGSRSNVGKTLQNGSAVSKLNKVIYDILDKNDIIYNAEFIVPAKIKDKESRKYYIFDIAIGNKLIEVNGDYWHGNPLFYEDDDIILKNSSGEKGVSQKRYEDKIKIENAKKQKFDVLVIWENEIKTDKLLVEKRILDFLDIESQESLGE